jgi:hypothetical protein
MDYEVKTAYPKKEVTLKEHPVGPGEPVSYMAYNNLTNSIHEITEILDLMNHCDDLPQWVDQMISEAADRLHKVKSYILSEKDVQPEHFGHVPHAEIHPEEGTVFMDYEC